MQVERAEIEAGIVATLAEVLRIDASALSPETQLTALGMTSIDFVEAIYTVEQKYHITIPLNVNDRGAPNGKGTVADTLRMLTDHVVAGLATAGNT